MTDDRPQTRTVRAARGTERTAKSWGAEAAKRMLMNNLDPEVAEHPEDLVVYGGTGKAARSWEAFDAIVRTLDELEPDETLLVQSGKPVGVFRTHEWAPRVLIANSNLVGDWATWPEFRRLEQLGLTMYGQMTAGSWIYIGTQGILQGTYETFAAVATLARARVARRHPDPDRRMRRHGRRAAARRDDERGRGAHRRRRRVAPRAPRRARLPRRVHDRPRRRRRPRRRGEGRRRGALGRRRRQRRRGVPRPAAARRRRSTSSPTRRARTTRSPTCRSASPFDDWRAEADRDPEGFTARARGSHGQAGRGDGRIPGCRSRGLRLRQLDPARGGARRLRAGVRLPRLRARPTSVRCSPRARARSAGWRSRATPRTSRKTDRAVKELFPEDAAPAPLARPGRREGALRGAARAHLLARLPGAAPRRPEVQRDGRLGRAVRRRS